MGLNKEQAEAASHRDGPMLVLAGPGSGKTHTLVSRIINLIEGENIPPDKILVITFSKKAATEMQARFQKQVGDKSYPVSFGTFHAVFYHILKYHNSYSSDSILTPKKQIEYIEKIALAHNISEAHNEDFISEVLSKISQIKSSIHDYKSVISSYNLEDEDRNNIQTIYEDYVSKLNKERFIDFDDMIIKTYELFCNNKDILKKWQERFEYFLVDEFQDINEIQYEVLMLLAGKKMNVFAVGDDDQSIYGFRGSNPEIMRNFANINGCITVNLLRNYRCAEIVIKKAGLLISNNIDRIEKSQIAEKINKDDGYVQITKYKAVENEAEYVISEIKKLIGTGIELYDIAILYRTNKCVSTIEEKLIMNGISYNKSEIKSGLYDSTWALDIISFLEIAAGNNNRKHFFKIIKMYRNIPRDVFIEDTINLADLKEKLASYDDGLSLIKDVLMLRKLSPYAVINYIFKGIGYERYMRKNKESYGISEEYIDDFKKDFSSKSKDFKSVGEWLTYIYELKNKKEAINVQNNKGVVLQTAHASKGLQYDVVFIVGLKEDMFPHNKAVFPEQIEEERRLMYVAMTRAKRYLYVCGIGDDKNGKPVSRFISEIEDK